MKLHLRTVSVLQRRWRAAKEATAVLRRFEEWRPRVERLPPARPAPGTLLIVRLDDIGDYLLFRNQLMSYRRSPRWRDHRITLLGNAAWRDLFELLDRDSVDERLWVDKQRYLTHADYRAQVWASLRAGHFDTVVAPSRTRPLLLDDLCMLAAAPRRCLGAANTYVHRRWNEVSDRLYPELLDTGERSLHEFEFNARFADWACGGSYGGTQPRIERHCKQPTGDGGAGARADGEPLLCFVGASMPSKRWPARRWIDFLRAWRSRQSGEILLAGAGATEAAMAAIIQAATGATNLVGRLSLPELLERTAAAAAVVTNDTMAAHLAASCGRPTVIIANGVNYRRFTEYGSLGIDWVRTVYPEVFLRRRRRLGDGEYAYHDAVTADIESIAPPAVLQQLAEALRARAAISAAGRSPPRSSP